MSNRKILGGLLTAYGIAGFALCTVDCWNSGIGLRWNVCALALIGLIFMVVGWTFWRSDTRRRIRFDNFR